MSQQKLAALSGGRILLALEGGYNTRATSEAAAACLAVLQGGAAPAPDPFSAPRPLKETQAALQATAEAHAPFWWAPAHERAAWLVLHDTMALRCSLDQLLTA